MLLRDVPVKPTAWPPPRDDEGVRAALAYGRLRDPIGHWFHVALAVIYLFLLPLATAPKDIAFAVLFIYACLRLHCTWRAYTCLLRDPLVAIALAWPVWRTIALLWSDSLTCGFDELKAFRVLVTPLVLWPVLDHLVLYVGAFLAGVLAQNGVQVLQALHWFGLRPTVNDRLDGLLHPIHTATCCAAALCWHLGAAIRTSGWMRWGSLLAAIGAAAGLVFSGSRGPWIAAVIAVGSMLAVTGFQVPRSRKTVAVFAGAALLGAAALWPVAGPFVSRRYEQAVSDLALARQGDHDTDVGARLALYEGAWRVFLAAPFGGRGPGDLGAAMSLAGSADLDDCAHAHSLYLHELASTGAVGFALAMVLLGAVLSRTFRRPADTPWSAGTPYVLIGWLVAAAFDTYQINGLTLGLFGFVLAIALFARPASAGQ